MWPFKFDASGDGNQLIYYRRPYILLVVCYPMLLVVTNFSLQLPTITYSYLLLPLALLPVVTYSYLLLPVVTHCYL